MNVTPIRILLIEDNPSDARLIGLLLEEARVPVVTETAADLATGIARLREGDLDAVLLDLSLPDSMGLETFTRAYAEARGVPVVVLSGLADEELAAEAVHHGAQDYLVKGQVDGHGLGRALRYAIERKRFDAELRRQEERLREAQQIAHVGSWEWEIGPDRVTWSDELYRIYGLEPGSLDATLDAYLERVHPDDRTRVRARLQRALEDRRPFHFDERIVRPDGSMRIVHSRGRVLVDSAGQAVRLVGACQDVTEQKQQELEIARARDAALRSAQLKSAFLANMSHEIRTPLNIILGYAGIAADPDNPVDNGERRELAQGIHRAAERLMTTIDGILDISKMETGNFDVRPEPLALKAILERLVRDFTSLAQDKGLTISLDVGEPDAIVRFDEYCLSHALMNLLQNAIKFTERGGVSVRLLRDEQRQLVMEIADTGVGIDPEYLPRIFEPFSQEEIGYTRRFEGSGLGLALTKEYLSRNGATISVHSRKGAGSVFRVELSRECEIGTAPSSGGNPGPTGGRPPAFETLADFRRRGRKPLVLVVEDDPDTQVYMQQLLRGRFELFTASSGVEARAHLERSGEEIALVLMDLSLRGSEDGLMLTEAMRHEPRWKDIPIIATTAHAFSEDRVRALEAGCNAFLAKPIRRTDLITMMGLLLSPAGSASRNLH